MRLYHGDILFAPRLGELTALPGGYLAVEQGVVQGVSPHLPEAWKGCPVEELGRRLLIPAFNDIHLHAAQLPMAGLGYDGTSDEWFSRYAYPTEQRYSSDLPYAREVNRDLIARLKENGIMRSVIMCATGSESTRDLMEQLMESGLGAFVGKMNSDYGAFGEAQESHQDSCAQTLELISWARGKSEKVKYILSPEFIPAVSQEMLTFLGELTQKEGLPVHSHMSEGPADLELVAGRFPQEGWYGPVWDRFGLFGQTPTVMAHCLYVTGEELELMARRGVYIAHCPNPAQNVPSGRYLSVRKALDMGIPVGLGSDIGCGHTLNMLENMVLAVQGSKMLTKEKPLTLADAFYLATKGGGSFFGRVGSFEPGYQFDALVIEDESLTRHRDYTLAERLQRLVYCGDSRNISRRFCGGNEVFI